METALRLLRPALLALLPGTVGGQERATHAVFYSAQETHLVSSAGERWYSPELLVAHGDALHRYRARAQALDGVPDEDGLRSPRRVTRLEVLAPGEDHWRPLLRGSALGEVESEQVLQLQGDVLTAVLAGRAGGATWLRARSVALPTGETIKTPEAGQAVEWLDRHLPGLVDPCVRRPAGQILLEAAGGQARMWLALSGASPECAGDLHAMPLAPPAPRAASLGPATWQDGALILGDARIDQVTDARQVGAAWGLAVARGRPDPAGVDRDLFAAAAPCAEGVLYLWRADGHSRALRRASALTGLRALDDGDPLVSARETELLPYGEPCHRPLVVDDTRRSRAHRCRAEELTRAWRGPEDLAVEVQATRTVSGLNLRLTVQDAERRAGDAVHLWAGPGRRPVAARIVPQGLVAAGRAGRSSLAGLRGAWTEIQGGYVVELSVEGPLALALTLAVEDEDAAGRVRMWVAGDPIDARQTAATACVTWP